MHTRATCNRIQFAFVVIMIPNVIRLQFAFVLLFWFMIIVYREFPIITIMQSSGYTISKNVKTFFAVGKKGFFCCGVALLYRFLVWHLAPWHPKKGYARRRKTYILGFSETHYPSGLFWYMLVYIYYFSETDESSDVFDGLSCDYHVKFTR